MTGTLRKVVVATAVAATASLFVTSASAAKPVPTIAFTPGVIHAYMPYDVTGCGYPRSAVLNIEWLDSSLGYYEDFPVTSDASGCFSFGTFQAEAAGSTIEVEIWHNAKLLADSDVQVIP